MDGGGGRGGGGGGGLGVDKAEVLFPLIHQVETPFSLTKVAVCCRLPQSLKATVLGCDLAKYSFWEPRKVGKTAADILLLDYQYHTGTAQ